MWHRFARVVLSPLTQGGARSEMDTTSGLADMALLIVDMISDFRFPDGAALAAQARSLNSPIRRLSSEFREAQRPVVYVNDNFGQWHLSFPDLVNWAKRPRSLAPDLVVALTPQQNDYFILKPKHSGFYETALPTLLHQLDVRRLALVGIAGDACILATALDAHMRDFEVWVPSDGTVSLTTIRNNRALDFLQESVQCDVRRIDDYLIHRS
jgi:nicotinamidase-related amidase